MLKRKRNQHSSSSVLPPLPDSFRDLYASTSRASTQDDPSLHGGRERQTPHVEGCPSTTELESLYQFYTEAKDLQPQGYQIQSLLTTDLGSEQPLHISLSASISLESEEKRQFIDVLTLAIRNSGIRPFKFELGELDWAANNDCTRWFLVMRAMETSRHELHRLLQLSNDAAQCFGNPTLYTHPQTSNTPKKRVRQWKEPHKDKRQSDESTSQGVMPGSDAKKTMRFHASIGWTLEAPTDATKERTKAITSRDRAWFVIHVNEVKVKIGNAVHHISLESMIDEHNGIIGS
ncbi:MAG: hypothetical protein Q9190_004381 [Brigantiaea leucoxantha]